MILLPAIALGFLIGIGWASLRGYAYKIPDLQYLWLVFIAFLPQVVTLYIPSLREQVSDVWAGILLTASQLLLLGFAWLNRKQAGMKLLLLGAALNFTVMAANGGFMPISPKTASRLVPAEVLADIPTGSRFGVKDVLLAPENTRLEWFADRFLPPEWFDYQVAFSLGDVLIVFGVFWLLAVQEGTPLQSKKRISI